jgi:hypothetical protein
MTRQPKAFRSKSERRRLSDEEIAAMADRAVSRNPRRAYDKGGREIPPATMGNIREQGINTLWATCQRIGCGHEARFDGFALPRRHARAGRVR